MTLSPKQCEKAIQCPFKDIKWLHIALTHRSAGSENNERLEFVGDSVLNFVIGNALFEQFPKANEGTLSRLRASLVNETTLAERARSLKLGDYLILGSGELKSGGFNRNSILSDALEAIIGAIFKDQGFSAAQRWILNLFADLLEATSDNHVIKDPKTRLQEFLQGRKLSIPVYTLLTSEGLSHEQVFHVECRVDDKNLMTRGSGSSRKRAEQQAAQKLLDQLDDGLSH
ncbi:MAG: ribonuclease III [Gammaproteobacteria bacterium]|nr:ribonuclease III [Gammaproteobacteria bacterium]